MLNRIEARNFKSFKRLDYKCAKLNLLTGLNGAGKSSFVQLMLLLRATASTIGIGKCQGEIDLRESGIAKSFGDIRYCYADKDEQMSFSVDFIGRNFAETEVEVFNKVPRRISRIVTASALSSRKVLVWHPEVYNTYNIACRIMNDEIEFYELAQIDDDRRAQRIVEEISAKFEQDCKGIEDAKPTLCVKIALKQ